jgi:23S rRNA (guanine745-N1)-methyltransferase
VISTQTKQQQAVSRMAAFNGFQCPVCGAVLTVSGTSLRCEKGHSYDVARKGYVHLHHTTVEGFYDKALFEARRAIFDAGFYAPVAEALKESLLPLSPTALLDAGCGEGYYLNCLSLFLPQCFLVGLDLSKEAILAASSRESAAILSVGDLGRLPFQNNVFDALLSILSPANYLSFSRVLKKNGRFIKVMPGQDYLREIRERLPSPKQSRDEGRVLTHLRQHMDILKMERIHYVLPLSDKEFGHFVSMTPLTESLTREEREAVQNNPSSRITIDLTLAVCAKRA